MDLHTKIWKEGWQSNNKEYRDASFSTAYRNAYALTLAFKAFVTHCLKWSISKSPMFSQYPHKTICWYSITQDTFPDFSLYWYYHFNQSSTLPLALLNISLILRKFYSSFKTCIKYQVPLIVNNFIGLNKLHFFLHSHIAFYFGLNQNSTVSFLPQTSYLFVYLPSSLHTMVLKVILLVTLAPVFATLPCH